MALPYEHATSGKAAIDEIQKILRGFGATSFGFSEDFVRGEIAVHFAHADRQVLMKASSVGYARLWMTRNPWKNARQGSRVEYERKAKSIGQVAVYSILRDWIKGQITAIEVGMLTFESAFLGQIVLSDGRTVMDRVEQDRLLSISPPT